MQTLSCIIIKNFRVEFLLTLGYTEIEVLNSTLEKVNLGK